MKDNPMNNTIFGIAYSQFVAVAYIVVRAIEYNMPLLELLSYRTFLEDSTHVDCEAVNPKTMKCWVSEIKLIRIPGCLDNQQTRNCYNLEMLLCNCLAHAIIICELI